MHTPWDEAIVIGSGGYCPGLHVLTSDDARIDQILSLPVGDSVYAVDRNRDCVVLGTKGGQVRRISQIGTASCQSEILVGSGFRALASVLSVCATMKNGAVVSDSVGACRLFDVSGDNKPTDLPTRGEVICSLVRVPDNGVAGLSTDGLISLWDVGSGGLVTCAKGPPPPRYAALVSMVHVPALHALVYPARNGGLVQYMLETNSFSIQPAHEGEWYGLTLADGGLVTAGMHDGRLLVWAYGPDKPTECIACPLGIQSLAVMNEAGTSFLHIFSNGNAGIHRIDADTLHCVAEIPGGDFRVVIGPECGWLKTRRLESDKARALAVADEITAGLEPIDSTVAVKLHQELVTLGYKHVSLCILAQEAERQGDLRREVHHRARLAGCLPVYDERTGCSLERYGAVLEEVWQFREAMSIYNALLSIQTDHPCAGRLSRLAEYMEMMGCTARIAAPEWPLHDLIEAANILGRTLSGRWLLKTLRAMCCHGVTLTPDALLSDEQGSTRPANGAIGPVNVEEVIWLSLERVEITPVLCMKQSYGDGPSLQMCCKVFHNGAQSAVVPHLVLDAGHPAPNVDSRGHNARVLHSVVGFQQDALVISWVDSTLGHLRHLLREAVTLGHVGENERST